MKSIFYYDTIIGEIGIICDDYYVYEITFDKRDYPIYENELMKECHRQLMEYFEGIRKSFDLPLYIDGTEFQVRVWKSLLDIPYGKTCTYKFIADSIGNEKAVRAVGNANNRNKIPIIIPCHRVIGSHKKLVGYAGGLEIKKKLLELEKKYG